MPNLYVDECGYTGSDLISDDQPFLIVGSLLLSDEEIDECARMLNPATQAPELKFATLVRRPRGRSAIVQFVRHLDVNQGRLRCQVTHKRYALLGKVLDLLVEPMFHASGQEFYRDGYNLSYLNMLYVVAVSTAPAAMNNLLRSFLQLCRAPTNAGFKKLAVAVRQLGNASQPLSELCDPILQAIELRRFLPGLQLDRTALGLMTSCVVDLVRQWNEELDESVSIIADSSNELFRSQDVLDAFSNEDLPDVKQVASGRVLGFPLRMTGLQLVDSQSSAGVQLADIAAGLVNHVQNALDDETRHVAGFTEIIVPIVTEWPRMLQVIPQEKFTPEELGRVGFDGDRLLGAAEEALRRLRESD